MKWCKVLAMVVLFILLMTIIANVALADGPIDAVEQVVDFQIRAGRIQSNRSATGSNGSWSWEYANAAQPGTTVQGGKVIRHYFGRTRKLTGTGTYRAEVHSTLLNGGTYGSPSVFDYLGTPCAKSELLNATAQACSSPWFGTTKGRKWFIITGHYFDIGANGSREGDCPGCIDWVYTTP